MLVLLAAPAGTRLVAPDLRGFAPDRHLGQPQLGFGLLRGRRRGAVERRRSPGRRRHGGFRPLHPGIPGEDGERFEQAKQIFRARAQLNSDDAEQLLGAGKFYLLSGDPVEAVGALQASLKVDPQIPAQYYLAYAKAQQGHIDEARQILRAIGPADAQYAKAQRLLQALASR